MSCFCLCAQHIDFGSVSFISRACDVDVASGVWFSRLLSHKVIINTSKFQSEANLHKKKAKRQIRVKTKNSFVELLSDDGIVHHCEL